MIKFRAWSYQVYDNETHCGMLGLFNNGFVYTIRGKQSEPFKTLAAAKKAIIKGLGK